MNQPYRNAHLPIRWIERRLLTDERFLESQLLPFLGLTPIIPSEFPERIRVHCGDGIRVFQSPPQFARFLVWVQQFPIGSYLELGVGEGGSFKAMVEILARTTKLKAAAAIDRCIPMELAAYSRNPPEGVSVELIHCDSQTEEFHSCLRNKHYSLAMIDADHSYDGVNSDFLLLRDHSDILLVHDIASENCSEVRKWWLDQQSRLSKDFEIVEFTEHYKEVDRGCYGIAALVHRRFLKENEISLNLVH